MAREHSSVGSQLDRQTGLGSSNQPSDCPCCGKHFKYARNIQRHVENSWKLASKDVQVAPVASISPYIDSLESQSLARETLHTSEGIDCPHCNTHLKQSRNLPRHLRSCPVCCSI